jgi:hypothetical protein
MKDSLGAEITVTSVCNLKVTLQSPESNVKVIFGQGREQNGSRRDKKKAGTQYRPYENPG